MLQAKPEVTLYDRLNEEVSIEAAVGAFYFSVLRDKRVAHFFADIDMESLLAHQLRFVAHAFGGPAKYTGRSMREAHRRLVEQHGLADEHFDAVAEIFITTLRDLGVSESLTKEAGHVVASVKDDVLGRR